MESVIDGQKSLLMIVPTSEFLGLNIPNNANSREFTGDKNKSVSEMITTLKTEPEMFRSKNLGIRMVANDYIRNENGITLFFDEDEGIFNGGHTFNVIKVHGVSKAFINITVDINLPKDRLVGVSIALNMSKKLELSSQGEKRGRFEWIKKVLPDAPILYKEGGDGTIPVEDVLKVANLFLVNTKRNIGLTSSQASSAAIMRKNNESDAFLPTAYILSDAWDLYNEVINNEKIVTAFPGKYSKNGVLIQGMGYCLLYGLQYTIELNKNGVTTWKEGYNKEKALKLCIKAARQVAKEVNKLPYRDLSANATYKDRKFHMTVKAVFADVIDGQPVR
jgi:hypothetical protein